MSTYEQSSNSNVCALVERQVIATPDATALIVGEEPISYRKLWQRVLAISAALQSRCLQAEEPVGIVLGRNLDLVASILGIWHAGGAYVPIDPDDPAPRNKHILHIADCRLLLSDPASMAKQQGLSDAGLGFELLDLTTLDLTTLVQPSTHIESCYSKGSALAYILFTSGSSGTPKGVQIEQRSVTHLLVSIRDLLRFTDTDRYLATASAGFDISVPELLLPLICGGSCLLRHRELWLSPAELAADIKRFGVTVVQAVPSAWTLAFRQLSVFPQVRIAITTGEAITPQVTSQLPLICDDAWNLYGPTETTVWATARRLPTDTADMQVAAAPSIGIPLHGLTAVVVDEKGNELPATVHGELCIGGITLARGYHRQAQLTAERFLERDGVRLYRTGDIAALEQDGSITCYGRLDDQLKIRGVRIEPGEIEAVMQAHPEVQIAAVTWFATGDTFRVIAAVYVPAKGCSPANTAIVDWVASRLPAQMVPARLMQVEELPLSPSGKVDRAAIRTLLQQAAEEVAERGVSLISNTEEVIADAWRRILQRQRVSREDHFFDIGGDSLAAVRVIASIESTLGVALKIRSIFDAPTLAALAELVDRALLKKDLDTERDNIFELARVVGSRPVFTFNFDLQSVTDGNWKSPVTLFAIVNWADGNTFLQSSSIEAFARIQLAAIRKRQAIGPYRLAGYVFGALMAFEIARQLEHQGETVEILFLIDPVKPNRVKPNHLKKGQIRFPRVDSNAPFGAIGQQGGVTTWLLHRIGWIQYQLAHLHGRNRNPIAQTLVPKYLWPSYWVQARRLVRRYEVRSFSGPTILISSVDEQSQEIWRKALPALKILVSDDEQAAQTGGRSDWRALLGTAIRDIDNMVMH